MIERFEGESGRKNLIEAIKRQTIIRDNDDLAKEIEKIIVLQEFDSSELIITQGNSDNDIYFIFSGRVSINIGGREIAIRKVGEHVGEMALIDISASRSASVIALENTVVGKINESDFTKIAENYPRLWRLIALELGERLRQRSMYISEKNPRPVIFIGSSSESLNIAREIESSFQYDDFNIKLWTNNIFKASEFPIESLNTQVQNSDFAILILGTDDLVISREAEYNAPRDNVIFELGLFMGVLSRHRTFMVQPKDFDVKIPTDLMGINILNYKNDLDIELSSRIAPICNTLRKLIIEGGTK